MKKTIFAVLALLNFSIAAAGPWDYTIGQYDQFGVSPIPRLVVLPSGSVSGIFIHNTSTNLPQLATVDTSLSISSGGVISVNAASFASTSALSAKFDSPTGTTAQYLRGDGTLATFPTIPAGQVQSDWGQSNSGVLDYVKNKPDLSVYATTSALTSGLAAKQASLTLTTTGSGAASLVGATLNIPTPASVSPFNFSQPAARTLAVSTSYQATDPAKAAIITPSYACQNATQVLASSACTMQVRMGTGTLTCSTGTVLYTQSLTVGLGLLLTQNSTNPVQINLPIGASFILCATAGTFTITTVEQSAG